MGVMGEAGGVAIVELFHASIISKGQAHVVHF
jgi:hypothetical protein